jgi:hypothetical protein
LKKISENSMPGKKQKTKDISSLEV